MSKPPVVTFRPFNTLLLRLGFISRPGKSGHVFYRHADGRTTTLPNHSGDLPTSLVRKVLRDIDLTPEQFQDELNK